MMHFRCIERRELLVRSQSDDGGATQRCSYTNRTQSLQPAAVDRAAAAAREVVLYNVTRHYSVLFAAASRRVARNVLRRLVQVKCHLSSLSRDISSLGVDVVARGPTDAAHRY